MRCRYSSGASAGLRGSPDGRKGALHAGVGGDHRAARVHLGAEIVEGLLEHVGEHRAAASPAAARAGGGGRGGRDTRRNDRDRDESEDDEHRAGRELRAGSPRP